MQGTGGTTFGKTLPPPNHYHHHQGAPQPVCGLTGLFLANLPLTATPNITEINVSILYNLPARARGI